MSRKDQTCIKAVERKVNLLLICVWISGHLKCWALQEMKIELWFEEQGVLCEGRKSRDLTSCGTEKGLLYQQNVETQLSWDRHLIRLRAFEKENAKIYCCLWEL